MGGQWNQSIEVYEPGTYSVSYYNNGCPVSASVEVIRESYNGYPCNIPRIGTKKDKNSLITNNTDKPQIKVEERPGVKELSAFPNPANNLITVAMPVKMENETPVLLYDMFGKTVNQGSIPKGEWKTDLSVTDLPDGIYVVRVGNGALINATKVRVRHQH